MNFSTGKKIQKDRKIQSGRTKEKTVGVKSFSGRD